MGGGWGLFGAIHMALWWILIILGIAVLAKWLLRGGVGAAREDRPTHNQRALEVLSERYARGEIGKEEFDQKKRDLSS